MTEKTEALRLADALELDPMPMGWCDQAAAELRRLHQFAEDQIGRATAAEAALQMTKATHALKIAAVEAQREALLEALRAIVHAATVHACHHALSVDGQQFYDIARAAIKAVEEEA